MDNYEYCTDFALRHAGRVLDFGCGAGKTVGLLRKAGREAFGCDTFFEGGNYSDAVPRELLPFVKRMDSNAIPFPDGQFNVVINNMVMEHVDDIDMALSEIDRVLAPGGVVLSLFPDRAVWVESHCKIPFLHRFPKGMRLRAYYAAAVVFFQEHPKEPLLSWGRRISKWLDDWTHYRTLDEIHSAYAKHFSAIEHIEERWIAARTGRRIPLPVSMQRFIVRRLGATAFTCVKRSM